MSIDHPDGSGSATVTSLPARELDVERDSDVPISTQIYWQLAYQIDSGRLLPGSRLPPVRDLGAALRVNPNTIRAVYKRLADSGYVHSRHGAGTHVADRPPERRGAEALAGLVAEMLRRAAQAGFTADEAQALVARQIPVIAMLVGPGFIELVHEVAALPPGSTVGLVCASDRGARNIAETLALSGTTGVGLITASYGSEEDLARVDRTADLILLSREALALKLDERFEHPDRVREWTYEFDPSGLELLRRAIERALADRPSDAQASGAAAPGSAASGSAVAASGGAAAGSAKAAKTPRTPVATPG